MSSTDGPVNPPDSGVALSVALNDGEGWSDTEGKGSILEEDRIKYHI